MLKRQLRLPGDFRLNHPFSYQTTSFRVLVAVNNLSYSRFGFVVRKAIDKRATIRNTVRRLLRSCIEEKMVKISAGYDMLFFVKPGIIGKEREALCSEVDMFLTEKHLLAISGSEKM